MPEKQSNVQEMPYSTEAEQGVLGSLMLDNERWDEISLLLIKDDFYHAAHQKIYQAMAHLSSKSQPLDLITLTEMLEELGQSESAGGFSYAAEVCRNTPSAANIRAYANIVLEKSKLRALQKIGHAMVADAQSQRLSSLEVAARAEDSLFRLGEHRIQTGRCETDVAHGLGQLLTKIENATGREEGITGTATGMREFDAKTCGLQPGELIILAARPSMGKTALALAWCSGALLSQPERCVFIFSLEMPKEQLIARLLSMCSGVELHSLRSANLSEDDLHNIILGSRKVIEHYDRLVIDDSSNQTPHSLRTRTRRYMRQHGQPSLIVIDYLQLVRCPEMENRTQEIAEISRALKALGKEIGCPILALSQLNRQVESRTDKRPNNGDLRDSGALEQDADVIALIYRDEVYHPATTRPGLTELIISKQRQGPTGTINIHFDGKFTLFSEYPVTNDSKGVATR